MGAKILYSTPHLASVDAHIADTLAFAVIAAIVVVGVDAQSRVWSLMRLSKAGLNFVLSYLGQ